MLFTCNCTQTIQLTPPFFLFFWSLLLYTPGLDNTRHKSVCTVRSSNLPQNWTQYHRILAIIDLSACGFQSQQSTDIKTRLTVESTINCFYSFCMCSPQSSCLNFGSILVYFYQKLLQQYFFCHHIPDVVNKMTSPADVHMPTPIQLKKKTLTAHVTRLLLQPTVFKLIHFPACILKHAIFLR